MRYTLDMKVLAIDPGYGRCGMAIVEKDGGPGRSGKEKWIYSVCIETPKAADFTERLLAVTGAARALLAEHKPDCVALEKLFFQKNQKTAMRVAEVRGALIECATQFGVPVHEYTPGQVKSAAAGFGAADKAAVARMLHALIKIEKKIQHDDEYDAIAIAVTHLAHSRSSSA